MWWNIISVIVTGYITYIFAKKGWNASSITANQLEHIDDLLDELYYLKSILSNIDTSSEKINFFNIRNENIECLINTILDNNNNNNNNSDVENKINSINHACDIFLSRLNNVIFNLVVIREKINFSISITSQIKSLEDKLIIFQSKINHNSNAAEEFIIASTYVTYTLNEVINSITIYKNEYDKR